MKIYTPREVATALKRIGKVQPDTGKGFATLELKIGDDDIVFSCKGPVKDLRSSQFNPDKFQLVQDVSQNGEVLGALVQLKRELEYVLEKECAPEFQLVVKDIQFNGSLYISWPKQGRVFIPIIVDGDTYYPGGDNFPDLETKIKSSDELMTVIRLFAWVRYTDDRKIQIGITPQLVDLVLK